jgi:phage terminase large subunit GpA-like protein
LGNFFVERLWHSVHYEEDFANNAVRQITVLCSAQSSKTETMLALLNWIIADDASPTMWVTSSDEEALKFANERLMPSLRLFPPVAKQIPDDRTLAKSMEIMFPTMMLEVVGANSKAYFQAGTCWLM